MKESDFVKQNNQKWDELESSFVNESKDPRQKSRLFTQITDDLSYARTFYKNRSVREYLNGTAQLLFSELNLNERFSFLKLVQFFTDSFPKAMYATRRSMLISLIIFALSFLVGAITAAKDPTFANEILGDSYVSMTENNIANDDPMAVYKDQGEFEMFWYIAFNNLMVAFRTFLFGVLTSVGSVLIMIYNGVMVGVFQYFFIEKGLFWTSFLTIWTHGTIEIACIIVAGGAGIQLGRGLLFPGTYSRVEAFKMSAKSALLVIAGITPLIIIAAVIESFQTRHTDINDLLRLGFILFCLAFVLFYFFWYPRLKFKDKSEGFKDFEFSPVNTSREELDTTEILSTMTVFSMAMGHILKHAGRVFPLLILISAIFAVILIYTPDNIFTSPDFLEYGRFYLWSMFDYDNNFYMSIPVIIMFSILLVGNALFTKSIYNKNTFNKTRHLVKMAVLATITSSIIAFLLALGTLLSTVIVLVLAPILIQVLAIINQESGSFMVGPKLIVPYLKSNWGKFSLVNLLFYVLAICILLVTNQLVLPLVSSTFTMFFTDSIERSIEISLLLKIIFNALIPFSLIYFFSLGANILFFTLKETNTADHLFSRIKKLLLD